MAAFIKNLNKRKAAVLLLALLLTTVFAWSVRSGIGPQAGARAPQQERNGALALRAPGNAQTDPGAGGKAAGQARSTTATIGQSVKNDVSPALRDLRPVLAPPQKNNNEGPENPHLNLGRPPRQSADPVRQTLLGPLQMPTPQAGFDGIAFYDSYPPDPNGDVGEDHYVQWVNRQFQIFTKTGASVYGPADGNTLWTGFGGPCETRNDGDPIVQYDPLAQRWLLSQFNKPAGSLGYYQCIAISLTADPTSSYYRYAFPMSATLFNDYPKFGVWPDAYYMSIANFSGNTYVGPSAVAFDRARMLAGQPAGFQRFDLPSTVLPILPADLDGTRLPPAGAPHTFAGIQPPNVVQLWKFSVNWANPAQSTFAGPTDLVVAPYDVTVCDIIYACIPQPISGSNLDEIADRPMYRLAYRNFGAHEAVVFNHTVATASVSAEAAPRWYEIRNVSATPVLYQQGTFGPADDTDRWMGSIAMDAVGNIALGYSVSSPTLYPSIRYTGRLFNDPLGTLPQGEGTIINGLGAQTGAERWGDYTSMSVDPVDDCTFWYTNQYYSTTSSYSWRTRIASFKFPNCTPLGTATPTATATATRTPTTPTVTATRTPFAADAYAQLQPGGQVTLTLGSKLVLDLRVQAGSNNVAAAQHYLTFTHSILQGVDATGSSCAAVAALQPDPTTFDTVMQNEICNGSVPCTFGSVTAAPGSVAFASAAIANPPATGAFRVARLAFCANAAGQAVVRWQLPPAAPADRQSEISDATGNNVSNPALYAAMIINVVGGPATPSPTATTTALATTTATPTATPTPVLVGHVTWQGRPAQPHAANQLPLTLTLRLGATTTSFPNVQTDAGGVFTVPVTTLPNGVYTWWVKGPSWLATSGQVTLSGAPMTPQELGLQLAGDVNNDNVADIADFTLLRATFGKGCGDGGYDGRADWTGDCLVDASDFTLLRNNFGQSGAPPP